jgi:hypothetical protein
VLQKPESQWKECPDFSVVQVEKTLLGNNPFSWVENARLKVRAKCIGCHVKWTKTHPLNDSRFYLFLGGLHSSIKKEVDIRISEACFPDAGRRYIDGLETVFLHLGSRFGLVLERSTDDGPVWYRRLGLVRLVLEEDKWKDHFEICELDII